MITQKITLSSEYFYGSLDRKCPYKEKQNQSHIICQIGHFGSAKTVARMAHVRAPAKSVRHVKSETKYLISRVDVLWSQRQPALLEARAFPRPACRGGGGILSPANADCSAIDDVGHLKKAGVASPGPRDYCPWNAKITLATAPKIGGIAASMILSFRCRLNPDIGCSLFSLGYRAERCPINENTVEALCPTPLLGCFPAAPP